MVSDPSPIVVGMRGDPDVTFGSGGIRGLGSSWSHPTVEVSW